MTYIVTFIKLFIYIIEDIIVSLFSALKKIILVVLCIIAFVSYSYFNPVEYSGYEQIELQISPNSSFNEVLSILSDSGLVSSSFLFKQFSKWKGYDRKIKSGEYSVPKGLNSYHLVTYLTNAKPKLRKLTIIEGLQFKDIISEISESLSLDSAKLALLFTDSSFLNQHNIKAKTLEGYILPQET